MVGKIFRWDAYFFWLFMLTGERGSELEIVQNLFWPVLSTLSFSCSTANQQMHVLQAQIHIGMNFTTTLINQACLIKAIFNKDNNVQQ